MIDHITKEGNRAVFVPILASTLTTMGALAIIYFLDDTYKVNHIDFAMVIVINLSISLFVALFLMPAFLENIPLKETKPKKWGVKFQRNFYALYNQFLKILFRFKKIAILFNFFF
jgi:multidrug efflux pump subunit AcrB